MLNAQRDLRNLSASQATQNRMATTMVAVVVAGDRAFIANVGDSRAYLWRKGELQQVTRDQSLIAKLLEEGAITEAEAATHPRRHVILYSLGSERDPRIDLYELALQPGDQILLCSDGLTRHVSDDELAIILGEQDPEEATAALVRLANERGATNIRSACCAWRLSLAARGCGRGRERREPRPFRRPRAPSCSAIPSSYRCSRPCLSRRSGSGCFIDTPIRLSYNTTIRVTRRAGTRAAVW